ncbi:MAG: hypothetical protein HZB12_02830 [Candidatus Yonathbacteria bacterium]|nr:hypothetical protein [Candidatus Yonathbacteria bacterium]
MQKTISKNCGFMQVVLLAIIIIAGLAYFNIDLRTIFARPEVQKVWHIFIVAWTAYIKPLLVYLWTNIGVLPPSPTVN